MKLLRIIGGVVGFGRTLRAGEIIDLEKEKRAHEAGMLVGCGVAEYIERYPVPAPVPPPPEPAAESAPTDKESSAPEITKRVYRKRQK